jgi:hypothetical protein
VGVTISNGSGEHANEGLLQIADNANVAENVYLSITCTIDGGHGENPE